MRFLRLVLAVSAIYLLTLSALGGALVWRLQQGPMSLNLTATWLNRFATLAVAPYEARFVEPILEWDTNRVAFAARQLRLEYRKDVLLMLDEVRFAPSAEGILRSAVLLPESVDVGVLTFLRQAERAVPASTDARAAAQRVATPNVGASGLLALLRLNFSRFQELSPLRYLERMDVPKFQVADASDIAFQGTAAVLRAPPLELEKSYLRLRRSAAGGEFEMELRYPQNGEQNRIAVQAQYYSSARSPSPPRNKGNNGEVISNNNRRGGTPPPAPAAREETLLPAGGRVTLTIAQLRPRSLAPLLRELPTLARMDFTIDGEVNASLSPQGAVQVGSVVMRASQGRWRGLDGAEQDVKLARARVEMDVNFAEERATLTEFVFAAQDNIVNLSGEVDYVSTPRALVSNWNADLRGENILLTNSPLSDTPLAAQALRMRFNYDLASRIFLLEQLQVQMGEGELTASGSILMVPQGRLAVDVVMENVALTRVRGLRMVSLRTRTVLKRFTRQARITSANIELRRRPPAPGEDASVRRRVLVEGGLRFDRAVLPWLDGMPPIEAASGRAEFLPNDARLIVESGYVQRPSLWKNNTPASNKRDTAQAISNEGRRGGTPPPAPAAKEGEAISNSNRRGGTPPLAPAARNAVRLNESVLFVPNYRVDGTDGEMTLNLEGHARSFGEVLGSEQIGALRNAPLEIESLEGQLTAKVQFGFPDIRAFKRENLKYNVDARTTDMTGKLYENYNLQADDLRIVSQNSGTTISGSARVNGIRGSWDWKYISDGAQTMELLWRGALGVEEWARLPWGDSAPPLTKGRAAVEITLGGRAFRLERFTLKADLARARLEWKPLVYVKAAGKAAGLTMEAELVDARRLRRAQLQYRAGRDRIDAELEFDETGRELMRATIAPLHLGDAYRGELAITSPPNAPKEINFKMERLQVSGLARTLLSLPRGGGMLGKDWKVDGMINLLRADAETDFSNTIIQAEMQDGAFAQTLIESSYGEDGRITWSIDRNGADRGGGTRNLRGWTNRPDELLQALGARGRLDGGEFLFEMELWDEPRTLDGLDEPAIGSGRMAMTAFQLRQLPLLAQLLSIASLRGLLDTLTNEGIHFDRMNTRFWVTAGMAHIHEGDIRGPALALSYTGTYDYRDSDSDLIGTLVPANAVNGMIRRIPWLGPLLVGDENDGFIGIRYAVRRRDSETRVSINPLTVITPSIFRRMLAFIF